MKLEQLNFSSIPQNLVFWKNDATSSSTTQQQQLIQKDTGLIQEREYAVNEREQLAGCPIPQFVPYTATVPWHSGPRNVFSKFFPRYGNYCGPNWSSGRESGSLHWDTPPIDWLDHCCYRHDMGYVALNSLTSGFETYYNIRFSLSACKLCILLNKSVFILNRTFHGELVSYDFLLVVLHTIPINSFHL